jgi:Protein of unknown function (DUF4242)
MQTFLVERDMAGISLAVLHSAKAAAIRQAQRMTHEGDRVDYLGSTFLPADGRCLCLFRAKNAEVVTILNRDAGLPFERITLAAQLSPE